MCFPPKLPFKYFSSKTEKQIITIQFKNCLLQEGFFNCSTTVPLLSLIKHNAHSDDSIIKLYVLREPDIMHMH